MNDRTLYCISHASGGLKHRMIMLSRVMHYAAHAGRDVCLLWGCTEAVAKCRFDELLARIRGVRVINLSAAENRALVSCAGHEQGVAIEERVVAVFDPARELPVGPVLCVDLKQAGALASRITATPEALASEIAPVLLGQAMDFCARHVMGERVGIRVRVLESPIPGRKPWRVQAELDDVLAWLIRLPWQTPVFVATDSEYVQQVLACHFASICWLPKCFRETTRTGNYVSRTDADAMKTFMMEVHCLQQVRQVVNVNGFLNDHLVRERTLMAFPQAAVPA